MIKLVAVDMDGTLLGSDGHISERNAYTIQCLQKAGVEFLICTGRSYIDALLPLEEKRLRASVVCMNGAAVYDRNGALLGRQTFREEQVRQIISICRESGVIYDFMTNEGSFTITPEKEFYESFRKGVLLPMAEISYEGVRSRFTFVTEEELFSGGREFYKLSVIHPDPGRLKELQARLEKVPELAIASSFATNLELTHAGAQKGAALAFYAALRGIRLDEIMAIGDSENDRSMLSMKLKYTVAMSNAMESIRRLARCQTRSNDEDGVAYAIETLVLSKEARAS